MECIRILTDEGLRLITECFNNLKASEYDYLYHTKFVVLRDKFILEYFYQKNYSMNSF